MRLRLRADDHYIGSRPGTFAPWPGGEERDVSEEVAAYLLATFPGRFCLADCEVPGEESGSECEALAAPEADRAMRAPRRRR